MKNKRNLFHSLVAISLLASAGASAKNLTLSITNLTFGSYFTPLLIAAHEGGEEQRMFQLGKPASDFDGIEAMAELGDISGLITRLGEQGANLIINPVGGDGEVSNNQNTEGPFLAYGGTVTSQREIEPEQKYLSLSAMILPSNDAFVGLDSYKIPKKPGTYKIYLNAYDAGTEINDERKSTETEAMNIPNPGFIAEDVALGDGATGVDSEQTSGNPTIHIHRGNIGDFDPTGGISDMDAGRHRWNNPVALLTLTVEKD